MRSKVARSCASALRLCPGLASAPVEQIIYRCVGDDAMREQLQDRLAYRTVAVRLQNGETEYWLTDHVFVAGDRYERNGHTWEVADVLPPTRNGRSYLTVRLIEGDD